MDCQNCQRLAEENATLKKEIKRLGKAVKKLQRKINAALLLVLRIYGQAVSVLRGKSGVPRGTWSLWKGQAIVAKKVHDLLME